MGIEKAKLYVLWYVQRYIAPYQDRTSKAVEWIKARHNLPGSQRTNDSNFVKKIFRYTNVHFRFDFDDTTVTIIPMHIDSAHHYGEIRAIRVGILQYRSLPRENLEIITTITDNIIDLQETYNES